MGSCSHIRLETLCLKVAMQTRSVESRGRDNKNSTFEHICQLLNSEFSSCPWPTRGTERGVQLTVKY